MSSSPTAVASRIPLVQVFAAVPDPRKPRGLRHALPVVLACAAAAVLAGARTWVAVAGCRRVTRTVQAVTAPPWIDFPGAAQVLKIRRTRTIKGHKRTEVAYIICSVPMTTAPPPVVAGWVRGHWSIENALHWVRDVVFDEDHHQLRVGSGPQVMASLWEVVRRDEVAWVRLPDKM